MSNRGRAIRARIRAWENERRIEQRNRKAGPPSGKATKILRGQVKRAHGAKGYALLRSR